MRMAQSYIREKQTVRCYCVIELMQEAFSLSLTSRTTPRPLSELQNGWYTVLGQAGKRRQGKTSVSTLMWPGGRGIKKRAGCQARAANRRWQLTRLAVAARRTDPPYPPLPPPFPFLFPPSPNPSASSSVDVHTLLTLCRRQPHQSNTQLSVASDEIGYSWMNRW